MVPKGSGQLTVGVLVGRILAWQQCEVWVAVHGCQGMGSVEVGNRSGTLTPKIWAMVALRHMEVVLIEELSIGASQVVHVRDTHRLVGLHSKGRPRKDSIVAPHSGGIGKL